LNIPPQEFARMAEKFELYFMISSNVGEETDAIRLATHMEETFIWTDLGQISKLDLKYISMTISQLMKLLENNGNLLTGTLNRISVVLLYLVSASHFSTQISAINTGILLNRYSKLMKILSIGVDALRTLP
jgi:hypothetical protein